MRGDHECSELEGQQSGRAPERPLWKDDQRIAGSGMRLERGRVLDAAGHAEALDENRAQAPQRRAKHRRCSQLALGRKSEPRRQRGCQQNRIGETRMVGDHDDRPRHWQAIQPFDAKANPRQADGRSSPRPRRAPAPGDAGQRHRREPGADTRDQHDQPGPAGPGNTNKAPGGSPCLRRNGTGDESRKLPPRPALRAVERAALVQFAAGDAANLAARGLQHRPRRGNDDIVRRHADLIHRQSCDRRRDPPALLGIRLARFRQHDQALGAGARVGSGEDGHASFANAAQVPHCGLELYRVDVGAAAHDDVFFATGEIQLACSKVAEVAGIEPVPIEQTGVGRWILVVALGCRGSPELNPALRAFGKLVAGRIHDTHLVCGQRHAARDHAQGVHVVNPCRLRHCVAHEDGAVHAIDHGSSSEWRERDAEHAFGQAIDREHRFASKAIALEAGRKPLDGIRAHRLGAVESQTPATEVQSLEVCVGQLVQA